MKSEEEEDAWLCDESAVTAWTKANGKASHTGSSSLSDDFVAYLWVVTYGACA